MKYITILALALLALGSCKTANVSKCPSISQREPVEVGAFAQPTPNKDTLYLLEKDPMALLTQRIWSEDTSMVKPAIIVVSSQQMVCIKQRCNGQIKENN